MSRKKNARGRAGKAAQAVAAVPLTTAAPTLRAVASYDAAGHGRRLRGWPANSSGPNRAITGLQTLRNRNRDLVRNEWTGAAGERVWGTNLIGTGIIARPTTADAKKKARYIEIWDDFCRTADADDVLDFYGLQTLAVESWRTSGEVFVRLRPRRLDDGLVVPLQVQLLESDMVPLLDTDAWPGLPPGHRIRSGIELNRIGRRTAYWCHREHPGDGVSTIGAGAELVRVPAAEMRHLFKPTRPGQLRGVPGAAPVIAKTRTVGDFDDAVLERQRTGNLYTGFITRPAENSTPEIDPVTGRRIQPDHDGLPLVGLEPGSLQELAPGEDVRFSSPPDTGSNYGAYMRQQHLGLAGGNGLPYELLTGDIKDVSDRTLRVILNDFRRTCEQYQWQLIIPMLCQFVRDAVARAAVLAGLIPDNEAADFAACTWHPHAWPYIHPTQDVQAQKMEMEAGFASRAAIVARRGDDVEQTDAERAADAARERRLSIEPTEKKAVDA